MMVLALDPATTTGWATASESGTWDLEPKKAAPTKGRAQEPESVRPGRLFEYVHEAIVHLAGFDTPLRASEVKVVVEGAKGFYKGKEAVRVAHELRGAIKAACHVTHARYEQLNPGSWKKELFGRGDVEPAEYLARAQKHLAYAGTSLDEAAALWILEWARRFPEGLRAA